MADPGDTPTLRPRAVKRLSPHDQINGLFTPDGAPTTVGEFWEWGFSDLRSNVIRGIFAEYLVAQAVGAERDLRISWDDYDLLTPEKIKVEVKSSGYLQSWPQRRLSTLTFSRLTGRSWNEETGKYSDERLVKANVFVFAVQTEKIPERYDMLDAGQWEFHVVSGKEVQKLDGRSVGITWVLEHAANGGHTRIEELAACIRAVSDDDQDQGDG